MAEVQDRTLRDVAIGDTATVRRLTARARSSVTSWTWASPRGRACSFAKVAPLGDPIEVTVRGYELSLRKSEAESILIG